ncbi:ER membrane protein complex subunit 3-like isoform X2 [Hylaeus volcanicus]|uniref:ER membrane protein complex subunit 3-like isoform X2 n=1 Tax=Hylaeus volcanicus TaxID=313075 RepID=UPI0023B883DA|nr:ER membrane protein complex subunit 3-like isoform X2 [Hylaeus volcanicus]
MVAFQLDISTLWGATLPIFFLILLVSFVRQYANIILGDNANATISLEDSTIKSILYRCKALRVNGNLLPSAHFNLRKAYFNKPPTGVLFNVQKKPNLLQNLLTNNSDPTAMVSNLKHQACLLFLNGGVGYMISFFFSGYLVAKTPFFLPDKLKLMLQRDVPLINSDASFMSSLSWYFFVLMTSTQFVSFLSYLWGDDHLFEKCKVADTKGSVGAGLYPGMSMGTATPSLGADADYNKLFASERKALELFTYKDMYETIMESALKKIQNVVPCSSGV